MFSALLFLNLQLLERVFSLNLGLFRIGPGELFILLFAAHQFFFKSNAIVPRNLFLMACAFFSVILAGLISNGTQYGFNSLLTIPARIIVVGFIFYTLTRERYSWWWSYIINFNLVVYFILLLLLSDASPFFNFELFNRNELMAYTAALLALRLVNLSKVPYARVMFKTSVYWGTICIILFMGFLGQSRQAIISVLLMVLVLYVLSSRNKLALVGKGLAAATMLSMLVVGVSQIELDGYQGARLATIQSLEPSTRGDKQRLANIYQGFEGVKERPVFGNGATSFVRDNEFGKVAHNTYVSTAYEFGLVGLMLLLLLLFKMLTVLSIRSENKNFEMSAHALGGLLVFFVTQINFIESFAKAPIYIFILCSFYMLDKSCRATTN